jgi:hypothetical protein
MPMMSDFTNTSPALTPRLTAHSQEPMPARTLATNTTTIAPGRTRSSGPLEDGQVKAGHL